MNNWDFDPDMYNMGWEDNRVRYLTYPQYPHDYSYMQGWNNALAEDEDYYPYLD